MFLIEQFLATYNILLYSTIFFGMFIEGTLNLLLFGALSHSSALNFWIIFIVAIFSELIHDSIFWYVGYKIGCVQKRKKYKKLEKIYYFLQKTQTYFGIYVFISKFIWNFNRITVISAGYSGMKYKKFMKISITSSILWILSLLSIGYVFADQTNIFKQKLWIVGVSFAGVFICIILIEDILKHTIEKYMNLNNGNSKIVKN